MKHVFYYTTTKWYYILGAIWLALGLIRLLFLDEAKWIGIGYVLIGLAWFSPLGKGGRRKALTFEEDLIIVHNGHGFFHKKIPLEELAHIENRYLLIHITTKKGKGYDLDNFEASELEKLEEYLNQLERELV